MEFEQGRWPAAKLTPWTDAADHALRRLVARRFTEDEIAAVRRVALWLEEQAGEIVPVDEPVVPAPPPGPPSGGRTLPRPSGFDPKDLGD